MQKIVGSVLIIVASTGIGLLRGLDLQAHLRELQCLKQLLLMLCSEIKYTKAPLGEAFFNIGRRIKGKYGAWLISLARQLEEKSGRTFLELWKRSVDESLVGTKLRETDLNRLKEFGMNMGYLDEEMQLATIHFYLEQLELEIQRAREELGVKRRLCNCLGVMGGIFLVVVFL